VLKDFNPSKNLDWLPRGKQMIIPTFKKRQAVSRNAPDLVYKTETYAWINVEVQPGETLALLSQWSGRAADDIRRDNQLEGEHLPIGHLLNVGVFPTRVSAFRQAREVFLKEFAQKLRDKYYTLYTVQDGDTGSSIARKHDVDLRRFLDYNPDRDMRRLSVGAQVRIPKTLAPFSELQAQVER
jgi:LysM repeat protein